MIWALRRSSATNRAFVLSNPKLGAANAAHAMVFTLLGASGHNSRTEPIQACIWFVSAMKRQILLTINIPSKITFSTPGV